MINGVEDINTSRNREEDLGLISEERAVELTRREYEEVLTKSNTPENNDLIDPDLTLDSPTQKLLDEFVQKNIDPYKKELIIMRQKLYRDSDTNLKKLIFIYSILCSESDLSQSLFKNFQGALRDLLINDQFFYSEFIKEQYKSKTDFLTVVLNIALNQKLENLGRHILELSNFDGVSEELIKTAIENKYFSFLRALLKRTKKSFSKKAKKIIQTRNLKYSHAQTFKDIMSHRISFRSALKSEKVEDKQYEKMDSMNDNLMEIIATKDEELATSLLKFYYFKYEEDYVAPEVLNKAVTSEFFFFIKRYFDIWPNTMFRFKDLGVIAKVLDMIEQRDTFVHALYLFSKLFIPSLSEIHVRMLIERLERLWKEKLFFFTYVINPILVCVFICQICEKIGNFFANVRVRLTLISESFLRLATLIKSFVHDELFIKTIYLKKFYPSNRSLLQILFSDRNFYKPLLQDPLIVEVVSDLWICDYNYTKNFMITASAFHNLKGKLIMADFVNSTSGKGHTPNGSPVRKNNRIIGTVVLPAGSSRPGTQIQTINAVPSSIADPDMVRLSQLQNINLSRPFHFVQKSTFFNFRMTNQIFSYFFWQKSSAYKVLLDGLIYMIFFGIIVENSFRVFYTRRVFQSFPYGFLVVTDGLKGYAAGYPLTNEIKVLFAQYMAKNKITSLAAMMGLIKSKPTLCDIMMMFFPEEKGRCFTYQEASLVIWDLAERFILYQFYFYICFLGALLELLYVYLIQRRIRITFRFFIDAVIFAANVYIMQLYYGQIKGKVAILRDRLIEKLQDLEMAMMVFLFLMWLKFLTYLKLTQKFGYVIKVMEIMIKELVNFFVIFLVVIIAFALVMYDLFDTSNENFSNFPKSIRTLLAVSYGQIFFGGYKVGDELTSSILMIIFAILSVQILQNVLIAILSSTYSQVNIMGNLENANIMYENFLARRPNKYYSCLISTPAPINMYVAVFLPLLIKLRSVRLNRWICMLCFIFVYAPAYFALYIAGNLLVLIPLCWGKYILAILFNLVFRSKGWRSIVLLLYWIGGGLFYLIWVFLVNDLKFFLKSLFYTSLNKERLDEISMEEISLITITCKKLIGENKNKIAYKEFTAIILPELNKINKQVRRQSMLNDPGYMSGAFGSAGFVSKKSLKSRMFNIPGVNDQAASANPGDSEYMKKNFEKRLLQDIEIDKMEVFGLIKQYSGMDGFIQVDRMLKILKYMRFSKKFSLIRMSRKAREKVVNTIQIIDMQAAERAVFMILAENAKSIEEHQQVMDSLKEMENKEKVSEIERVNRRVRRESIFQNIA